MLIHEVLVQSARRNPEAMALRQRDLFMSYGQLHHAANTTAAALLERSIGPGDRVATVFDKSMSSVAAMFGVWMTGGVVVQLNPDLPPPMFAAILADCQPKALLGDARNVRAVAQAQSLWPSTIKTVAVLGGNEPCADETPLIGDRIDCLVRQPLIPHPKRTADELAAILYTSGSTGRQKGVMWSHRNLRHHVQSVTEYLRNTSDDRLISVLPLYFGYGLSQVLTAVGVGASLSLVESMIYPHEVLRTIQDHGITGMAGVPSHFQVLLSDRDIGAWDFSSVRYFTISGATSSESLVRSIRATWPHVDLYLMFGQTESCIRSTFLDPAEVDDKPTSIGKAIPGVQIFVLDETGRETAPGGVGELVCRGPNVMMGYWNDSKASEQVLRPCPSWCDGDADERVLYTGDLVRRDAEGFLFFVGRRDEMIKSGAHRIVPLEIESTLCALEGIRDAAVIGEPDLVLGQVVAAHIVLEVNASLTPRAILEYCRSRLPSYMVPRRLTIEQSLPRTATGKIQKFGLRSDSEATTGKLR